jgi:hypothetical protein
MKSRGLLLLSILLAVGLSIAYLFLSRHFDASIPFGAEDPTKDPTEMAGPARSAAPLDPLPPGAIDLLSLVELPKDAVSGKWKRDGRDLITPMLAGRPSSLLVPYSPPEEYDLVVVGERAGGVEALYLGLVQGPAQFSVIVDGKSDKGYQTGIECIDGQGFRNNTTSRRGRLITSGRRFKVEARVRESRLNISVDGTEVIAWRGDFSRLTPGTFLLFPHPRAFYLGAWESRYVLSQVYLVPKKGAGSALR